MKKALYSPIIVIFIVYAVLMNIECGKTKETSDSTAPTIINVKIGEQVWMPENLNVSTFRNGELIPEVKDSAAWVKAGEEGIPAWCYYNNDPANGELYGKLYNRYAVTDPRGLAPEGWHVPNQEELETLLTNCGGAGTSHNSPAYNALIPGGSSGFNSLLGGSRGYEGGFGGLDAISYNWSVSAGDGAGPSNLIINISNEIAYVFDDIAGCGFSVRCMKDNAIGQPKKTAYTSAPIIKNVVIDEQVWMAENLDVSLFRNGDPIPETKNQAEWEKARKERTPAWCYYENDLANGKKYGKLYNWYAINDPRGLAPQGWHVPNQEELETLLMNCGGEGTSHNSPAYNSLISGGSSGFNSLLGGYRVGNGGFYDLNNILYYWSSSQKDETDAWGLKIDSINEDAYVNYYNLGCGFPVRCVKD